MSLFSSKPYNTATQIEAFIDSLTNFEKILETDPNEFNKEKLCKYINSKHFNEHRQKCFNFCKYHISSSGCVHKTLRKFTLKNNPSWLKENIHNCKSSDFNSAKIVLSIYKLMDRIQKGETGGWKLENVSHFFEQKFNEILELEVNADFEEVIGKINCELPPPSFSLFARGKKTKRRRVRKGKGKSKSRRH
jgi:hypothetical protein